jgi:hypothetical protein
MGGMTITRWTPLPAAYTQTTEALHRPDDPAPWWFAGSSLGVSLKGYCWLSSPLLL